jgi:Flp pilus assembly protein TadB
MIDPTLTTLIGASSCSAITAAWAAWRLTRKRYSTRLEQLSRRHVELHEAATRLESYSQQQITALRSELTRQRARADSAVGLRVQRERRAALVAALAEEASKPAIDDASFADTEPMRPQ